MKNFFYLATSVSAISIACAAHADFDDSGTDYSVALAAQEKWAEDAANQFISMPNSFACIIANSGAEVNANGNWTSLIDEVACGLAEGDAQSGGVTYSRSAMTSSRASAWSPQEVTAFFNSQGEARYIADVTLNKSASETPPFGEWYFSFYNAGQYDENTETWSNLTKETSQEVGYVDISQSGDDVQILVAQEMEMEETIGTPGGNLDAIIINDVYAKVLFVDGSSDNTKFVGELTNQILRASDRADTGFGNSIGYAGATSADYYFRQEIDTNGLVANTEACFDRNAEFKVTHDAALYNFETGAKVELSGGFGFQTSDDKRGYLGSWGVWIDGGDTVFTKNNTEVEVTDDDGASYTIKWAPGKLEQRSFTEEALSNGDTFKFWYWQNGEEVTAVWDAANSRFTLTGDNTNTTMASTQWDEWMWSDVKRTSVKWSGGTSVYIENRKDLTFSSTFADATSTKFYSKDEYLQHTDASALPYTLADFANNGGSAWWDDDTNNGGTNGARQTYFLTGSNPGGSLEPHTLYLDDGNDTLSSDDAPVRFDFGLNDSQSVATAYDTNGTQSDYTAPAGWWPGSDVTLILASDADSTGGTCDLSGGDISGCTNYRWQFGAMPWDHSKAAYDADGALVALDDPIMVEYTYASTDDRNNGMTIDIMTNDEYNPLKGCVTNGDDVDVCSNVTPSDYNDAKFLIEFDGQDVHGLPGMEVCTDSACEGMSYWMRLVNLKDGTKLTDTKGNDYVYLAGAVATTMKSTATANCSAIAFTSLDDLGLTTDDLPDDIVRTGTDYPLPSSVFSDAPTTSACTVTMGDTSNCSTE
jgi:hypothetical protein